MRVLEPSLLFIKKIGVVSFHKVTSRCTHPINNVTKLLFVINFADYFLQLNNHLYTCRKVVTFDHFNSS